MGKQRQLRRKGRRISKRYVGIKFYEDIRDQEKIDQIMRTLRNDGAEKVVVLPRSAFVEYGKQRQFKNGTDSASSLLDVKVESLDEPWMNIVQEFQNEPGLSALHGYTHQDIVTITTDPAERRRNKGFLTAITNTSARDLVQQGLVSAHDYGRIVKAQEHMGILLKKDDHRVRLSPGSSFEMTFCNGQKVKVEVTNLPPEKQDDEDVNNENVFKLSSTAEHKRILDSDCKKRHHWIWSSGANLGKTTNIRVAVDRLFAFQGRVFNSFWDHFDEQAQFIFLDEYGNSKDTTLSIGQLNSLCDGTYSFNMKGIAPRRLMDPTGCIVIIFSNKPPEKVHVIWDPTTQLFVPNEHDLSLLKARFNVTHLVPKGWLNASYLSKNE